MSHALLTGVAAATTHRDRDELDRSVAELLLQFLATLSVTLLQLVHDGQVKRVVRRVSSNQHGGAAGPFFPDELSKSSALVIVLDRASESGAGVVFERLRVTIEEYEFPQVGRVTVSIGYTRIGPADVPALCVERADATLYYAKSHGRNGVRNWETLLAAGEIDARRDRDDVELF